MTGMPGRLALECEGRNSRHHRISCHLIRPGSALLLTAAMTRSPGVAKALRIANRLSVEQSAVVKLEKDGGGIRVRHLEGIGEGVRSDDSRPLDEFIYLPLHGRERTHGAGPLSVWQIARARAPGRDGLESGMRHLNDGRKTVNKTCFPWGQVT